MDSRLEKPDVQLLLSADWAQKDDMDVSVIEEGTNIPVFTGDQFFKAHPREYRIVVALRSAYGMSAREVARVVGCSRGTVAAIDRREMSSATADAYRAAISNRLRNTLANVIERIDEALANDARMRDVSPRELASLMKETAEKLQLFSGAPTHRSESTQAHTEDMDYLRELQRVQAIEGEATTTQPGETREPNTEQNRGSGNEPLEPREDPTGAAGGGAAGTA